MSWTEYYNGDWGTSLRTGCIGEGRGRSGGRILIFIDDLEHVPYLKCVPNSECVPDFNLKNVLCVRAIFAERWDRS